MATLKQLRIELGWSTNKLANEIGISFSAIRKAENGISVPASTAKAIADTLSKHLEREIKPWEIEGLNIQ